VAASGTDRAGSPLCIHLFGPFEVCLHGHPLPRLRYQKSQSLLALLALRPGAEVERDWLAGLLWPESTERQALRNSLTDLRRALGPEADRLRSPTLHSLALDLSGAEVDVLAFDAAIAQGDRPALEQAVSLYRGPLLEGSGEEWAFHERQVREQAYLRALETLAADALAGGAPAVAEGYLRRAVGVDPLREGAQRALMQVLAAGGNYGAALLAYRELRLRLHRELNAEPDPETKALFQQIRAEARRRAQAIPPSQSFPATAPAPRLPPSLLVTEGTVTFLFTDIEGSTRLWEQHPESIRHALSRHDALLRHAIESQGGEVFKTVGDEVCAAFVTAPAALAAALEAQRALQGEAWDRYFPPTETGEERFGRAAASDGGRAPGGSRECPLRVRIALHTGAAEEREGDYVGPPLNRVARLLAVGYGGQVLLSQPTYELVRDALPDGTSLRDLGEHRLKDLVRPEHIFQLVSPDLPADFPPLHSLDVLPNNLPRQLTSFIGREREMAQVKEGLTASVLLTLTGTGGCGKTRLALQAAADLVEAYPHGVWLVELAALADPHLVAQSVASVLGIRELPGRPLTETLIEALRPKQLLLVLDNCEHLVAACAALTDLLLHSCPRLQILATSREALGVSGERLFRVPSLSAPDPQQRVPVESLTQYEAVRLFIDRAVMSQPSFAVTNANAPVVAQICHRLDGIPLAIELAAARVKVLSAEQIMDRLDDRFRLLTGGSRTALPRQQTLRALVDWSYNLLSQPEQVLLRRLSVFAGGWTLAAAEAVCSGEGIETWDVLELLTQLADKSLILAGEPVGQVRYQLLETIRQYGAEKLCGSDEAAVVQGRHRDWFTRLAEEASAGLKGADQAEWLARLETELDNLRTAIDWSIERDEAEAGLQLAGGIGHLGEIRGYLTEARARFARLLSLPEAAPHTEVRAKGLWCLGHLARYQGDYEAARELVEESLSIGCELGDRRHIGHSYLVLGSVASCQGDYDAAQSFYKEGLVLFRELGDSYGIAWTLHNLACVTLWRGDHALACARFEEGLALFHGFGDKSGILECRFGLARVAIARHDWKSALSLLAQCMALCQELGAKVIGAQVFGGFAKLARVHGQAARAARLLGAAQALRDAMGAPVHAARRADHERQVSATRTAIGEEAFAAAWAEGQAMTFDQALAYAGEEEAPQSSPTNGTTSVAGGGSQDGV
jgi:predicted ATPase/class 3 adenylate cyclase